MRLVFSAQAWDDYQYWLAKNPDVLRRVNALIGECRRAPFSGTGKPEPLKGDLRGWWSRRVTREDRLVYRVSGTGDERRLEIAQCRQHY